MYSFLDVEPCGGKQKPRGQIRCWLDRDKAEWNRRNYKGSEQRLERSKCRAVTEVEIVSRRLTDLASVLKVLLQVRSLKLWGRIQRLRWSPENWPGWGVGSL